MTGIKHLLAIARSTGYGEAQLIVTRMLDGNGNTERNSVLIDVLNELSEKKEQSLQELDKPETK